MRIPRQKHYHNKTTCVRPHVEPVYTPREKLVQCGGEKSHCDSSEDSVHEGPQPHKGRVHGLLPEYPEEIHLELRP